MFDLESEIRAWRENLERQKVGDGEILDELESHLRERMEHLTSGLPVAEAFQIATLELGTGRSLKGEFSKINGLTRRVARWFLAKGSVSLKLVAAWLIFRGLHEAHFPLLGKILARPELELGGLVPWILFAALQIPIGIGLFTAKRFWLTAALFISGCRIYSLGSSMISFGFNNASFSASTIPIVQCLNLAIYLWAGWVLAQSLRRNLFRPAKTT
jgi:hypothetical protein